MMMMGVALGMCIVLAVLIVSTIGLYVIKEVYNKGYNDAIEQYYSTLNKANEKTETIEEENDWTNYLEKANNNDL